MKRSVDRGSSLEYLTVYPDGYTEGKRYPLIILLHGFGASKDDLSDRAPLIDRDNYLYVLPDAPLAATDDPPPCLVRARRQGKRGCRSRSSCRPRWVREGGLRPLSCAARWWCCAGRILSGRRVTFTSPDGWSGHTATLTLCPRLRLWRETDELGTLERRYSFDGRRLVIGQVSYRRQVFGQPAEPADLFSQQRPSNSRAAAVSNPF
ncbi:hypothetical protein AYO44_15845 [Planctomycetaceae bacterium SCGC AG-212-F19]|nr:hypothetical protein AYO44_15845 [Planctomycetaceae bacterium SCGC AG-212-F19]